MVYLSLIHIYGLTRTVSTEDDNYYVFDLWLPFDWEDVYKRQAEERLFAQEHLKKFVKITAHIQENT